MGKERRMGAGFYVESARNVPHQSNRERREREVTTQRDKRRQNEEREQKTSTYIRKWKGMKYLSNKHHSQIGKGKRQEDRCG